MAARSRQYAFTKWMGPLLDALRALGGSAKPRECTGWIADHLKLSPQLLEERLKSGADRFHNQVQWARQYLVWEGLIDSSRHGVWTLTISGSRTRLSAEKGREIFLKWVAIHSRNRQSRPGGGAATHLLNPDAEEPVPEELEEQELLEVLQSLSPDGFERLCKRLLHEYGLEKVVVTGKSHDGGVDGEGLLRLNPFVTLKILFQCKRIKKGVSRAQVGDFRNAVMGRAEKGILLTTGWFSAGAEKEANREGVLPIELVDGERLVELFESKPEHLGLRRKTVFEVDQTFFDQFR